MSLFARMLIPILLIVSLATSLIGWKAYHNASEAVVKATRTLELSTLDAVGRELTIVMSLTGQHLRTVADRIAIIDLLRHPNRRSEEKLQLITRHLRRAVVEFPSIDSLIVLDEKGSVAASVNPGELNDERG